MCRSKRTPYYEMKANVAIDWLQLGGGCSNIPSRLAVELVIGLGSPSF